MNRDELKGKQTPGEVRADGAFVVRGISEPITMRSRMADCHHHRPYIDDHEGEANAALYAEAHNVANRTGMWPEDMEARIKELEEELNAIREQGKDLPI